MAYNPYTSAPNDPGMFDFSPQQRFSDLHSPFGNFQKQWAQYRGPGSAFGLPAGSFDKGAFAPGTLSGDAGGMPLRDTLGGAGRGGLDQATAAGSEGWGQVLRDGGGGWTPGADTGGYGGWRPPNAGDLFHGDPFSGNRLQQDILTRGYNAGAFDPRGNQAILDMITQRGLDEGRARERHAVLGAELSAGDDPLLRAFVGTQARYGAQNDLARSLSDARLASMLKNQDFLQQILANYFGGAINRKDPKNPNALAQFGGQAAGSFLGSLI